MFIFKNKKSCCDNLSKINLTQKQVDYSACKILVLGTGCKKCQALEQNVKQALEELNIQESVAHISDLAQIASYGVVSTPALIIDNKLVSYGKLLSKDDLIKILKEYRAL